MEKHLLEAAERGDAAAQFNLGILYENGLSDSRYTDEGSRPEAVRWLLAAAEQGLPRAQKMYAGEPEMPDSAVRACGWILLATASLRGAHLQSAQSAYQRVCMGLTPAEIETGQVLYATLETVAADRRALLDTQKSPEGANASSRTGSFRQSSFPS